MKKLFVIFSVFLSSFVFGQVENIYYQTGTFFIDNRIYNYTYDDLWPKRPTDTTKFDGRFTTEKLSIAEPIKPNDCVLYNCYITSSDSFVNEIVNEFFVDNPNNPTEITFSKTNIKLKLNLCTSDSQIVHAGLLTNYSDSVKYYTTDSDLSVTMYYFGNSIEVVNFGIQKITENTHKSAQNWYSSVYGNKNKISKNEILALWINETFMKNFNSFLPNKNYAEELIKKDGFQFSFSKESHYYEPMFDRWSKESLFETLKTKPLKYFYDN